MEIFKTKKALQDYLESARLQHKKIALVPTMGALHQGHISLIDYAKPLSDIIVCSIFVNPTQFNDPNDLAKYPRPIANDIQLLEAANCDILFQPSVEEMYSADEKWSLDLGNLANIWEGEKRPGHFQGVTQIVYKLFSLVQPDIACFGQKDFQQVMVIQHMIQVKQLAIELAICPIIRAENGLALSSRNSRLSETALEEALALSRVLSWTKENFQRLPLSELNSEALRQLSASEGVEVEYFAICESRSLEQATSIADDKQYVALLTAWVGGVRLIDNMILN
ncbi:pantoate--beta-alanine ligase [Sphingobacteriaceae bacterium WQ 2009]|uniref:Pantothenate synthetase n=1 Tax=Rhinopithecimicrobium faecis TaxID=2820698 RepID=A0A8T4H5D0_9SPHI|nr:pantoate--beta-alanine ligase [Sphingobacteriaceae bacterium WQ 2009]